MGCVQSRGIGARAPLPPRFILLGGFGGTLLAVLILGMVCIVYDCHLWPVLQCWGGGGGLLIVPLCIMGSFYTGNGPFSSVGELMGCV